MRTGQERGPRSEKMPTCESFASHQACSWVLRKLCLSLFPSPVTSHCPPTTFQRPGKRPGIPRVTSALSFPSCPVAWL